MVIYRIRLEQMPQILQKVMKRNLEELSRHLGTSSICMKSDLVTFCVPFPDGDF